MAISRRAFAKMLGMAPAVGQGAARAAAGRLGFMQSVVPYAAANGFVTSQPPMAADTVAPELIQRAYGALNKSHRRRLKSSTGTDLSIVVMHSWSPTYQLIAQRRADERERLANRSAVTAILGRVAAQSHFSWLFDEED